MATATPTANSPLTACCTLCRRTSRRPKISSAATSAAQIPGRSPPIPLATMKARVGTVASTMPRQPPSCSSTRCRSKTIDGPSSSEDGVVPFELPVTLTQQEPSSYQGL